VRTSGTGGSAGLRAVGAGRHDGRAPSGRGGPPRRQARRCRTTRSLAAATPFPRPQDLGALAARIDIDIDIDIGLDDDHVGVDHRLGHRHDDHDRDLGAAAAGDEHVHLDVFVEQFDEHGDHDGRPRLTAR
jgi:hypothetical protein